MSEDQLLAAILANPDSDAPRLAYAADADRRGDPRGELIRLQIELRAASRAGQPSAAMWSRIKALIAAHQAEWTAPVAGLVTEPRILRGFVEDVRSDAAAFLAHADELFRRAPIRHLRLENARPVIAQLAASPHLLRIRTLDFTRNRLGDDGLIELLKSPYLRGVRALNLGVNDLTRAGVEALAASDGLPDLDYVSLTANRCDDPVEVFSDDAFTHKIITSSISLPPFGQELEAKYGHKKWLHAPSLLPIFPLLADDL